MCRIIDTATFNDVALVRILGLAQRAQKGGVFALANAAIAVAICDGLRGGSTIGFEWVVGEGSALDAAYLDLVCVRVIGGIGVTIPAPMIRGEIAARITRKETAEIKRIPAVEKFLAPATAEEMKTLWDELFELVEREQIRAACRTVLAGFRPAKDAVVTEELRRALS